MSPFFDGPTVRALIAKRGGVRVKRWDGSSELDPRSRDQIAIKLAIGLDSAEDGKCWEWIRGTSTGGYGVVAIGGKSEFAHRAAYRAAYGGKFEGLSVCHSCDNPRCINPEHLNLGTAKDNMRDCAERGRRPSGDRCNFATLTAPQVREILRSDIPTKELAAMYGVQSGTVANIRKGKSWKHISRELRSERPQ